jgi:hypothetical protein
VVERAVLVLPEAVEPFTRLTPERDLHARKRAAGPPAPGARPGGVRQDLRQETDAGVRALEGEVHRGRRDRSEPVVPGRDDGEAAVHEARAIFLDDERRAGRRSGGFQERLRDVVADLARRHAHAHGIRPPGLDAQDLALGSDGECRALGAKVHHGAIVSAGARSRRHR